jgi:hypothetical protein
MRLGKSSACRKWQVSSTHFSSPSKGWRMYISRVYGIYCSSISNNSGSTWLLLLLLPFVLGPLACFPSELIWNYDSYRQSVGLLGRVISPVARPLPTQDNTNTEETRTNIHASSEIRTHDPSVWTGEDTSCLGPLDHYDRQTLIHFLVLPRHIRLSDLFPFRIN